ncbi:glycosyltransferase family 2 protein [Candidatus Saccharibacteria bacterium]|nr:glycosyltransferase family 2 protein [Candidatus Saccharibacteria bacterium]
MKDETLVSVVIPVWNIEEYVEKCLRSLVKQSYSNLEIIVVDDGSTDNSGKICDDIARENKMVRVFHTKNGGLSSARNFGIKKASGEIIFLVDGDDYVKRDFIKKMVSAMSEDVDIVVCGYNEILPKAKTISGEEATIDFLVKQENLEIVAWNKAYRKKFFKNILYPVGDKNEDVLTTYKLLAMARKVAYVREPLYVYVERGSSTMATEKMEERLKNRERAATEAIEYFLNDEKLKTAAEVDLLLAKYAYIDASIKNKIDRDFLKINIEWIKKNKKRYYKNVFLTNKLRFYNLLVSVGLYKLFRTII